MDLKKTKKAKKIMSFLCAVALIGSTSYQMIGSNGLLVSADTVSNFNVYSMDSFDWENWHFGNEIPSSEKLNFGNDVELWGKDIVSDTISDVTETIDDMTGLTVYEWTIPATEIIFLGGKIRDTGWSDETLYSQQMLFGKRIENAFTVKVFANERRISYISLIPNMEFDNENVKGYVLPDDMNISFNTQLFNDYSRGYNTEFPYFCPSKSYSSDETVTYSFPKIMSVSTAKILSDDDIPLYLQIELNDNFFKGYNDDNKVSIFGKEITLGEGVDILSSSKVTQVGRTFECSSPDNTDVSSFCGKGYNASAILDKHTGYVTFNFDFGKQDEYLRLQDYMYNYLNNFNGDSEEMENLILEYKKVFLDKYTVELSTKSKEVADNIVTALKSTFGDNVDDDYKFGDWHFLNAGYRFDDWDFCEENLSVTPYEHEGETYYRIEYHVFNDVDFIDLDDLNRTMLFELPSVSFTIPVDKLVDSNNNDGNVLVGVPYDFYDDRDAYSETLDNTLNFNDVLSLELGKDVLKGDFDGNGVINTLDLMRMKKYVFGMTDEIFPNMYNKYGADTNGDGNINILDVIELKRILLQEE